MGTTGQPRAKLGLMAVIGPGILVAATGVGAGDLATASFAGMKLGVAIVWAAVLGAFLKFVLNEGLARWQMVTGDTLLEGCVRYLGRPFQIIFLLYLLLWTLFVGAALMAACGVATHGLLPIFKDPATAKIVFGILNSAVGAALVLAGGFKLFERIMSACIALMFLTVITAAFLRPDWAAMGRGLVVPSIPMLSEAGVLWTVALMGGVGGTLTVLCYGYWIREAGRTGPQEIRTCRIDLAVSYAMAALFAVAMVTIGSQVEVQGEGAKLMVALADKLEQRIGSVGRWAFLAGAWAAVFSSLLGVWQSVPYLFADFVSLWLKEPEAERRQRISTRSITYRSYLAFIAVAPIATLFFSFQSVQKYYSIFGACFIPFLAVVLIYLNGSARHIGPQYRNHWSTNVLLVLTLLFFGLAAYLVAKGKLSSLG